MKIIRPLLCGAIVYFSVVVRIVVKNCREYFLVIIAFFLDFWAN